MIAAEPEPAAGEGPPEAADSPLAARLGGLVDRLGQRLGPLVGILLLAAALFVLHRELAQVRYHELTAALHGLPWSSAVLAVLLTALNYLVLTGYDQLAFAYIGKRIPRWRIGLASFVGYAVSYNVGLSLLSGPSVRYRFYSRWGLSGLEISRIVAFYAGTFFLGLITLGGLSILFAPLPGLESVPGHQALRVLGGALAALGATYVVFACLRRSPLRWRGMAIALPGPRFVLAQLAIVFLDWLLAVAVLAALMPGARISFLDLMAAFLAAQVLGLVSHVPGGLGVFETAMLVLLRPSLPAGVVLPALILFRIIYYLLPLAAALVVLLADEISQQRAHVARWGALFGRLTFAMAPKMLAAFTFGAGTVLLISGATPPAHGRLSFLSRFLPLALLEFSHFAGSVVGAGLLLLSHGIARRLDVAYYLAVAGLLTGMVASLLKGGDFEEALVLALVLLAFVPSRRQFDRRAEFFAARFSIGWVAAVLAVVGASLWLGLFVFRHVEYSNELWWTFEMRRNAPRFLRASAGVMVSLLMFGFARLLRPAPPESPTASSEDLEDAARVIAAQDLTTPYLVFLRDKALIWNEQRTAFVMYGVKGRTWVALGDPVGPPAAASDLVRAFLERCDDFGGRPVFYEVRKEGLHRYVDYGLTFVKLGEEAIVPLERFSLEGPEGKGYRNVVRRLEREGGRFRVIDRQEVEQRLPALREISDAWLRDKGGVEKSFSLGRFDPHYVARFPAAVVEVGERIVAFATMWCGGTGVELSTDLMRHSPEAPKVVMEALFVHLLLWGKERGYRLFNLGMAPLSGIERSPVASGWSRIANIVYRHGQAFYSFEGLRGFKDKFHPQWQARYLAYPGGLSLPAALTDVSALIAGGYRKLLG